MMYKTPTAAGLQVDDFAGVSPIGVASGAKILTLDGALPIEHLYPGDRVITRNGARRIEAMSRVELPTGTSLVEIEENALGGRPDCAMWLPASQKILLRDWRAKALYGQAQACVPVGQLVDGEYVRLSEAKEGTQCFQISFGRPEIFYADGLELASADEVLIGARA